MTAVVARNRRKATDFNTYVFILKKTFKNIAKICNPNNL